MNIELATKEQGNIVGMVHSKAWKQAYQDVFPKAFLEEDTPQKREQEFLEAFENQQISYYLLWKEDQAVGIVKVHVICKEYEVESIYILEQMRNKGYGRQAFAFLKEKNVGRSMVLWVLEMNHKARDFYEKNGLRETGRTRQIERGKTFVQLQYRQA